MGEQTILYDYVIPETKHIRLQQSGRILGYNVLLVAIILLGSLLEGQSQMTQNNWSHNARQLLLDSSSWIAQLKRYNYRGTGSAAYLPLCASTIEYI